MGKFGRVLLVTFRGHRRAEKGGLPLMGEGEF